MKVDSEQTLPLAIKDLHFRHMTAILVSPSPRGPHFLRDVTRDVTAQQHQGISFISLIVLHTSRISNVPTKNTNQRSLLASDCPLHQQTKQKQKQTNQKINQTKPNTKINE